MEGKCTIKNKEAKCLNFTPNISINDKSLYKIRLMTFENLFLNVILNKISKKSFGRATYEHHFLYCNLPDKSIDMVVIRETCGIGHGRSGKP